MNTTDREWSRFLQMANEGDGFAVDHLVEGKLRGCLPSLVEDSFVDQCHVYWTRDSPYTEESKISASIHDIGEATECRDGGAVRMDFRVVDEASMRRLIGIGIDGNFEVSVTFHPNSDKKIRAELREEAASRDDLPLLDRVRGWEAIGFKMVREWTQKRKVSSARTIGAFVPPTEDFLRGSRAVSYTLIFLPRLMHGKTSKGVKKGIVESKVVFGLREDPDAENTKLHVMRLQLFSDFVPTLDRKMANENCTIRTNMKIQTGSHGAFVDGNCEKSDASSVVYTHGNFGSPKFDCGQTSSMSVRADPQSSFSCNTLWMLTPGVTERVTIGIEHEMGDECEGEKKVVTRGKMLRWLWDTPKPSACVKSMHINMDGNFSFMDDLERWGLLRRVRNRNKSWKLDEESKINARKASIVASARF
jgi:hypothetical protein